MKTSTVMLLGLFAFIVLGMVGVDLTLKSAYTSIDLTDPYRGYTRHALKPFKYVKLTGQAFGVVEIKPSDSFELREEKNDFFDQKILLTWEMSGDTLVIKQRMEEGAKTISSYVDGYLTRKPHLYIMAPSLAGVSSYGIVAKVTFWPAGDFSVNQVGNGILISDSRFDNLTIKASKGSYVAIDGKNRLGQVSVTVADSSRLGIQKDVIQNLSVKADSSAHIDLPGSLLRKSLNL